MTFRSPVILVKLVAFLSSSENRTSETRSISFRLLPLRVCPVLLRYVLDLRAICPFLRTFCMNSSAGKCVLKTFRKNSRREMIAVISPSLCSVPCIKLTSFSSYVGDQSWCRSPRQTHTLTALSLLAYCFLLRNFNSNAPRLFTALVDGVSSIANNSEFIVYENGALWLNMLLFGWKTKEKLNTAFTFFLLYLSHLSVG